jgi:putative oxidoreductase
VTALARIVWSQAPRATVLIRAAVGAVFLSEGIQKLLFASELGAGRFERIGIPLANVSAPFTAFFEIVCGLLVILGLGTRLAAIPLLIVMTIAIASTKIPILLQSGFWKMAHEARTDFSMLLCGSFLLVAGAGPWSIDAYIASRPRA